MMRHTLVAVLLSVTPLFAADVSGTWVARITGPLLREPQYARVLLRTDGGKLTGTWNKSKIDGSVDGGRIEISVDPGGKFAGELHGGRIDGEGTLEMRAGEGRRATASVQWELTREPSAGRAPKTWTFEPAEFQSNYSAAITPVLRVFPGDSIQTSTLDSGGLDSKLNRRSPGGNPETGPFYVEGALPGDTLVVHLNKVRLNRDTARSGSRINFHAISPAWAVAAKYEEGFNSEWKLDRAAGVARLVGPSERMNNYTVPILPMIGCVATAPPAGQSFRAVDLGPFGGNLDYNQMNEGATLLLPVFQPGALFSLGDGHAAMGDGELTGAALETSLDVEFTVDLMPGSATPYPRLMNNDYLMSIGVAGSVEEALQAATAQLADWLKADYHLNDNEIALVMGTALKYDVAQLVDPHFDVVAKLPKSALASLKK
jgi:acetamidase/formamidase